MKQFKPTHVITIFMILAGFMGNAQELTGLWQVTTVKMGDQEMTPVAKWFKFEPNHTYTSGNGGIKNSEGTWNYDEESGELNPIQNNGIKDEAGPFKVKLEGNQRMNWTRKEGGNNIQVILKRLKERPNAIWDDLYGAWQLMSKTETDQVSHENTSSLFLRWDREYRISDKEGNISAGYWHINSHRPVFTMMVEGESNKVWEIEILNDFLIMRGLSENEKNIKLTYKRSEKFPG